MTFIKKLNSKPTNNFNRNENEQKYKVTAK